MMVAIVSAAITITTASYLFPLFEAKGTTLFYLHGKTSIHNSFTIAFVWTEIFVCKVAIHLSFNFHLKWNVSSAFPNSAFCYSLNFEEQK